MKEQIKQLEQHFQFLEDKFNFEYFNKKPKGKICKSINYYKNNYTIEIQLHKNLTYFYVNVILEKDESFSITSFNNKMLFCDDLTSINLKKAKEKIINHIKDCKINA